MSRQRLKCWFAHSICSNGWHHCLYVHGHSREYMACPFCPISRIHAYLLTPYDIGPHFWLEHVLNGHPCSCALVHTDIESIFIATKISKGSTLSHGFFSAHSSNTPKCPGTLVLRSILHPTMIAAFEFPKSHIVEILLTWVHFRKSGDTLQCGWNRWIPVACMWIASWHQQFIPWLVLTGSGWAGSSCCLSYIVEMHDSAMIQILCHWMTWPESGWLLFALGGDGTGAFLVFGGVWFFVGTGARGSRVHCAVY